jgi:hypothetical protein
MTRLILSTLVELVLFFVFSMAIMANDTPGKAVPEIGFIQLGHISRIDAKNHTLMLSEPTNDKSGQSSLPPRIGGFGRGRFGRFGGLPPWVGGNQISRTFETKVALSSETILKGREGTISFDELKVGDFVEVVGVMHGKDFQAKEVRRHSEQGNSPGGQ